jgi:hypothetical protein
MIARLTLMLACLLCMPGCASVKVQTHDFCQVAKPILVSKSDQISDDTAKEVLAHNLTGRQLCGW